MLYTNGNPGALAGATGADFETGNFYREQYTELTSTATLTSRRSRHLQRVFGVPADRSGLLAALAYGEARE